MPMPLRMTIRACRRLLLTVAVAVAGAGACGSTSNNAAPHDSGPDLIAIGVADAAADAATDGDAAAPPMSTLLTAASAGVIQVPCYAYLLPGAYMSAPAGVAVNWCRAQCWLIG